MCANSWAYQYLGVAGWWKGGYRIFIELSWLWQCLCFLDLSHGQSSDKNEFTIPRSLQDLSWWELRDIYLLVGVSDVSGVGDHLRVDNVEDGFDTNHIAWEYESLQHVNLSSSDLIISILFIPGSIFVEPVVCLGPNLEWVTEVGWSGWSEPVSWSLSAKDIINQFLILSFSIILKNSKVSWLSS